MGMCDGIMVCSGPCFWNLADSMNQRFVNFCWTYLKISGGNSLYVPWSYVWVATFMQTLVQIGVFNFGHRHCSIPGNLHFFGRRQTSSDPPNSWYLETTHRFVGAPLVGSIFSPNWFADLVETVHLIFVRFAEAITYSKCFPVLWPQDEFTIETFDLFSG
jgi:hypothetical protein